ncbi:hypothetical protein A4X06_0g4244 [Tilletia controversa]|uniref:Uncharacterized protein n=1 Tax=Tilletia controversa TaxID=13291 RepID=A0A8X7SX83_9BASI|nr:hypothetical protein A4X06_0g4244 [Tilletia controversa]
MSPSADAGSSAVSSARIAVVSARNTSGELGAGARGSAMLGGTTTEGSKASWPSRERLEASCSAYVGVWRPSTDADHGSGSDDIGSRARCEPGCRMDPPREVSPSLETVPLSFLGTAAMRHSVAASQIGASGLEGFLGWSPSDQHQSSTEHAPTGAYGTARIRYRRLPYQRSGCTLTSRLKSGRLVALFKILGSALETGSPRQRRQPRRSVRHGLISRRTFARFC